ncbi:hypothetical protein ACP4OV_014990 [Aristida adscensionis]
MASSRAWRCLLFVSLAMLPLGILAADSIGSYCAGTSYAGHQKAVATINSVLADGNNVIYGLAQCRGDIPATECAACLAAAADKLPTSCGYKSLATIWYDYCLMRYENTNFTGQIDTNFGVYLPSTQAAKDATAFAKVVGRVLGKAAAQAAAAVAGGAGLGRDKERGSPPFMSVYGLAECTRDLAPAACAQCLATAVSSLGELCGAQDGCQINYSSCRARYEVYPFYFPLDAGHAGGGGGTDMARYTKAVVHHRRP